MVTRLATLLLAAVGGTAVAAEPPHFEYAGDEGPANWARLSPGFASCGTGRSQSPISIARAQHDADLPPLDIRYTTLAVDFKNNGHAVQTDYAAGSTLTDAYHDDAPYKAIVSHAPGSTIGHLDSTFELKQFHFHAPSEHQLNGRNAAAEVHFVHVDKDGNIAVIGVLVQEGAPHPTIARLWQSLPGKEGQENPLGGAINAADLLPGDRAYYFYQGSLTTPPCTEGVRWLVMKEPITMSAGQIAALKKAISFDNNRPVQPMYGRVVFE
jgi:carbonic anhydrase